MAHDTVQDPPTKPALMGLCNMRPLCHLGTIRTIFHKAQAL